MGMPIGSVMQAARKRKPTQSSGKHGQWGLHGCAWCSDMYSTP